MDQKQKYPINPHILVFVCTIMLFCRCSDQPVLPDETKDSPKEVCCKQESSPAISDSSEITCPLCGYKRTEKLPTEVCMIRYSCEKCGTQMTPKDGDCCVFCTYGTHKCPSKQEE